MNAFLAVLKQSAPPRVASPEQQALDRDTRARISRARRPGAGGGNDRDLVVRRLRNQEEGNQRDWEESRRNPGNRRGRVWVRGFYRETARGGRTWVPGHWRDGGQ